MKTLFLKKWKLVIILIGLLLLFNSSWAQYPTLPYHPVGTESGYSVPANPFDFFDNITNVTFAGINNTTGAGPQWRMNYSGLTHATVERGQTYTLSVSVNASADFSYHDINVFFDWDNDGDCGGRLPTSGGTGAEANEKYDVAIGAGHANPATINITIPANATIGTIWMRVVLDADGSESDYLSYFSYGEIEEYAIDISSGITVPTVTTTAASNIATTSATLGGNVTADGGATVDARGIVYSLTSVNPNPQIGGTGVTQVSIGSGTGAFSQSVSSLSASSAYSFNSYAHNSQGYAYGTVSTFTTLGPEINIEGNSTSILDGDPSPSASDHTDFGSISTCVATEVRTFTIRNTGTADLTISSVDISGTNAADFSVTLSPAATITPSNTTTFQVTFNPSASGTRSATITVNNDDSDEAAYDFAIQGTGTDLSITALSQTNVSCSLGSNGAASVNAATGGTAPYSYNWTPGNPTGDGTTTVTGLPAGTWTCTVTDANGCTAFQDFTITQPSPLSLTAASQTNVSCNGGSNGAASVNTATGGAGGYTYNWTPGNPTGDGTTSVTGLTAGTWTCTVTDANSCTTSQNFTLTQPAALTLTAASQTNVSCNGGSNGAASVNAASGGAGGYTYNWTPGNPTGDGTTSITGLTAGSWTCTVTDANSCTASVNFTVIQPSALSLTPASQTNIACNGGATGAATVNAATGGAGGYTYDWTPGNPTGDGTVSVTGLTAGTWTCTVTDANGCTAIRNFTITQPTLLTLTQSSQTNIACYGDATGAASVNTANGGAGGYTYNWTPGNPTGDGTISISALTEGTWTCTVTDANNCTATADFTLTQPASALSISIDAQSNETAFGAADGAASVTAATGGTPTYNYDWTPGTPTGDGTNSVTGLTAGSYTCTVTDANSCTAQETFLILSPPQVVTTSATSIDITSATLGGEVTADGENVVTNRGIVYSTSDNTPEIGEPGITQDDNGSGIGSFSESISTLSAATTYYYQAYAINGEGTSYGGVEEFTTQNTILSIVRDGSTLTNTSSVSWTITFAASATGLTSSNFTLANTGLTSPSITNVSGSGTTWTVTANTSSGSGTLGLDFTSNTGLNAEMSNILPYIGEVYTIDKVAPLLSSSNPTDNSTTVFLGANVVLNFDENLVKGTGNITIRNSSDNSIFEQIDIADSRVTISGSQVTVNPSGVFLKGTGYYIEIDGTAIEDNAGNSYAGISGSTTLNFTTVDVVINEVVTDPQLDWSTFGFNGIVGAGAVTDYDEWVELYINTSGINFSGWTIELMDGSDIIGNLSALGAFVTSRYFGIGNFTSTISGDYLVLGRGNGSPMNNSITINLKDPTGAIVDAVTFNTNPSSNSDDQYNETAQRFPNGTDTNTAGDWTQGEATLGTANSGPSVKLSVSPASIGENAVASTVTATLCRASSQITTVTISNSGTATLATDYTLSSTSIVIPAGSTTGTATVTSIQDPTDEADETVTIDITTVTNGSEAGTQQQTITITDDNDPPLVTLSASPSTIAENDVPETSTITATLAVASAKTVTVTISASSSSAVEGFDYSLSSTTITILPGFLTGTATISSIQDADVEGHQTIDIDITGVSNCTEDGTQQVTLQLLDDDLPKVTLSQDVTSFGEEGGTNTITATLDNSYSEDAVITLGINASSTGTVTSDFTLSSTTITILAGNATGTATLTGISDNIVEADETIIVEILSCTNSIENGTQQVTSTITDDDVAELSIVATTQAAEDATDGLFTLSTTKQFDSPVTVTFSTSGTAASATDFTATGTTVVFPALSNTVTIPIEVLADNIVESDETVIVTMTNTSNSDVTIAASPNDHATVTITDDDVAELSIVSTTQATEDGTAGRFTISTTKMFDSPVTVTFAVTGNAIAGTDYSSLGTTVSFPAMVADAVIFVNAANDNIVESDETVIVTMTATSNTDVTIAATPNDHATVTITDDDVAELSIVATTQAAEDATNGVFTISTTKQFDAPVTVTFTRTGTATSASDFTSIGTSVEFPALSNSVTIPVDVIADNIVESDETVIVTMTGTSNTDVTIAATPNDHATVTITDDDVAELSIVATTQAAEDATNGVFTISTTKQFDAPVTVTFTRTGTATSASDFTAIGTSVVFPALSNTVTIPIDVIADNLVESDETVIVTITGTSNTDVTIVASPNDHATVTITDDDVAELSIVATTQAEEDATDGLFTISTTKQFDAPVTVTFTRTGTATSGTDFTAIGTTVVFPALSNSVTIPVDVIADNIVESDETVIVTMTATSNTDVTVAASPNNAATVTITDNDVAELSIVATTQAAEDATNGVFTISTTKQFDAPVTVTFTRTGTATSASDFTAIGTTVVFPAYSNTVTIPVEVIADDIVESDETLIVTMTGTSNTDVTVAASPNNAATVTITDDDVAELSIVATTQAEEDATDGVFTISTTKQFDAPVTVTFAGTGDANAGTDFTAIGTTVEFPALSNSVTIPIEVIADDFVEGDETVIVTMNATNNSDVTIAASPDNTANITITDDDYATLRITRKANAYENVSDGSYYVITDKQFDSDVNVGVSAGGTATAGTDYTAIVSPQLFPANTDTLTITVAQLDDSESEINEYVILNLLNTNNARVSIAPAPDSTATVTIFDDDQPLVVLSQSVSSFSESGGKNAITATLNKVHHTNVYVTLAASGTSASGVDFVMPATITIPAGSLSASDTLRAVQDQLVEADETVVIDILSITNGVENGTQQVSSTIIDDDNALLHIAAATNVYENISDGSCFVITDKQFDADIEVSFSVSGTATAGTDYTALASPVIFPAYTDTLTIAVQQIDDSESEIIEYVIMNLLGTNNAKVGIMPAPDSTATITIIDDDMPLVELSQSALTFSEASGQNILTATLNKVHHDDVVVSIAANSGTATPGTDFSLPASITVEAGEITGSTTVTAIQDNLVESNETLTIEIASVLNGVENGTQEVSSTIIDDDIATLSIVATSHAAEDATNGLFTIFTNKQFDTPSTITFTLGGTATEGVDFLPVGTTVLFPAFTDYIEIPVEIVADDLIESKETVIIELTGTSAGNVLIGAQDKQTIAITDNDYGYLTASVNHHPTEGDGSQGIITIYSSKTVGSPVEVFFATDGTATQGADYAFSSPKVIIPEGADSVNVLADIFDDKLVEGNEYLTFVITGTSTKAIVADSTWANLLHMDIYDNDKAYIWLEPLADVNENGTPGLFAIRTDKPVQRDLEVEIFSYGSAIAGIDYVAPQRWFTYPAGDTSMTIPVIPIPDEIVESADSIVFSLLQVNCPNTVMKRDDHDAIALFIADDDSALISIAADSPVDENIQQAGFTLSTLKAFDVPVLVYYSLSGTATIGADFSVAPAPLLLPTLTNVARIPVSIIDDASIEGTETITVTIDSIMHAKAATDQGASSATLLVNDNDFVTLSVSSSERINERGFASFALTLGQAMETGITVTVSVGGTATEGTDFLALGRTFTIPAGQTELLLPVTIISDQVNEGDETIVVSIVSVSNAAVRPSLPASATLTITDDDPLPSISVLPASALENQGKISFLAKLSRTSGSLVSFVFSTSASGSADILSDFVYASDTLVFEPGETVKPIDITIIDDEAEEPDETFFLLLSDPQNALLLADSVAGTIINDDGRPVVTIRFTEQGIDENGGTAYLKASLDRVSGKEVSVFLAFDGEAENGTDVDVAANSFVLAPGMLADSILVTGLPDDIDETNEHLTVSVTATENAALAPGTILSLLVSDQDQTIHFEPVDQTVYGGPSFDLSASSSSGLIPVFSSDNQGVASIQGNTVTIKGAGTALITASQPGNGYFDPAGEVSQLLVVGKAELSVSVLPAQRQYGEEDPLFDLSFNGFVNGDSESSIDAEPIAVSSASAQSAPGVYTVTLSGGSDNNYSFAYLHGSLTVEKADQTIVFDLPASVNSTEPLALGATASSGLTVYYESSDLDVVRINGNTAIIVGPGTVTITARQDGDANYLPAESVSKTMVVNTVSASRIELDGPLCFPNPFVNVITLNQACSDATMVQVMDLAGRVVLERKNPGLNIDASALRNGSYLINITLKNGTALSQLIIKK